MYRSRPRFISSNHASRLLVRHPHVMARLRSEIGSVLGDGEHPSREKIRKMPYLAMVVKESEHRILFKV